MSDDLLKRADKAIERLLGWTEMVGDGGLRPREVDVAEKYAKKVQQEIRNLGKETEDGS